MCVYVRHAHTRAQMYGWTNADELQAFQYAADAADSAHGNGAGIQ